MLASASAVLALTLAAPPSSHAQASQTQPPTTTSTTDQSSQPSTPAVTAVSQPQSGTSGAVGTSGSMPATSRSSASGTSGRSLPATGSSLPLMIFTAIGLFAAAGALRAYRLSL